MLPGGITPPGAATTGAGADGAGAAEDDADAAGEGASEADSDAGADAEAAADGDPPAVSPSSPLKMLPRMNPSAIAIAEMSPIASTGRPCRGVVREPRYALMPPDYGSWARLGAWFSAQVQG